MQGPSGRQQRGHAKLLKVGRKISILVDMKIMLKTMYKKSSKKDKKLKKDLDKGKQQLSYVSDRIQKLDEGLDERIDARIAARLGGSAPSMAASTAFTSGTMGTGSGGDKGFLAEFLNIRNFVKFEDVREGGPTLEDIVAYLVPKRNNCSPEVREMLDEKFIQKSTPGVTDASGSSKVLRRRR